MAGPKSTRTVRLTRSIILAGEHTEEGSEHEVSRSLGHRLVGEGSAVFTDDEETSTAVNRMESPQSRDPESKQVAPAPAKVKKGDK